MSPVLEVANLTVVAGGRVLLQDVTLSVSEGETAAVIGPNGAGKTTLLKAVLGLIPVRSGSVRVFGKPLAALGPDRHLVGYVPQRVDLDRAVPVTVSEFVDINTPRAYRSADSARRALAEVDAERLARQRIGDLSGGELQRVLIALNLLHSPRLLLLDEPATGIDHEGERRFYDIMDQLRVERRLAVLMVSHDFSVVYRHASRVICISRTVQCQGPPADVLNDQTLERLYGRHSAFYEHHNEEA